MTLILNRVLEDIEVHVHANFINLRAAVSVHLRNKKKLDDYAENNTAVASAGR